MNDKKVVGDLQAPITVEFTGAELVLFYTATQVLPVKGTDAAKVLLDVSKKLEKILVDEGLAEMRPNVSGQKD